MNDEISRLFALQRQYQWDMKATSSGQRKERLARLRSAVVKAAPEVVEALYADLRKTRESGIPHEAASVISDIDDAIDNLDNWMAPVEFPALPALGGARSVIRYEPRGVCLLFGPWNFPFQLVFEPLVPLIAAGNCVIIKPNEMAPATSRLVAAIIRETFDEREVAVLEGGVDVANALLALPFDHIFFTGSPKVARTVMAAAAKHLSSVTLELGGKCPAILDESVDLEKVAPILGEGRMSNSGQICLCVDHVWAPESMKDRLVERLSEYLRKRYYKDGQLNKEDYGRMIDTRNFARVKGYVDDAVSAGAKIAFGGEVEDNDLTIHPTILVDAPLESAIMQEEIFGPVLPVLGYRSPSEITDYLRRNGKPLAMYLFTTEPSFIEEMMMKTSSGGVTVNGWAMHWFDPRMPFGGVNQSGIGRYHGVHGFRELSHERSTVIAPAESVA